MFAPMRIAHTGDGALPLPNAAADGHALCARAPVANYSLRLTHPSGAHARGTAALIDDPARPAAADAAAAEHVAAACGNRRRQAEALHQSFKGPALHVWGHPLS